MLDLKQSHFSWQEANLTVPFKEKMRAFAHGVKRGLLRGRLVRAVHVGCLLLLFSVWCVAAEDAQAPLRVWHDPLKRGQDLSQRDVRFDIPYRNCDPIPQNHAFRHLSGESAITR
jgi:hypothetical protein